MQMDDKNKWEIGELKKAIVFLKKYLSKLESKCENGEMAVVVLTKATGKNETVKNEDVIQAIKNVIAWMSGENEECTFKDKLIVLAVCHGKIKKRGDNVCQA